MQRRNHDLLSRRIRVLVEAYVATAEYGQE